MEDEMSIKKRNEQANLEARKNMDRICRTRRHASIQTERT